MGSIVCYPHIKLDLICPALSEIIKSLVLAEWLSPCFWLQLVDDGPELLDQQMARSETTEVFYEGSLAFEVGLLVTAEVAPDFESQALG